jgi:predicted alpha/beta superfamily hydrolase
MDRLSDSLLETFTQKTPPVIVAIGYQTNLPFDQPARAYDYRPKVRRILPTPDGTDGRAAAARHFASY